MEGFGTLYPAVLLLAVGFIVVFVSRMLKMSPIVGFILAGLAFGPYGLDAIPNNETTKFLAKLGVVFLLFDIGLHVSMRSAWNLRKDILGLAPLQVFLCGLILGFATTLAFNASPAIAILVGMTFAISSTAVVMQVLQDLKIAESPIATSAKSILIFQDIVAIFLLIFIDTLGSDVGLEIILIQTLLKTALAFAAVLIVGRYCISPLMKLITKTYDPEIFTIFTLLIVTVTALATGEVGLSLTLGAFLAGMALAETPFRVLLQTELRPFRTLLLALFFISVGMLLDPILLQEKIGTILTLALLIIAVKAAVICALLFVLGKPPHKIIQLSFILAQGSEFAFIIFGAATVQSAIGGGLAEQFIAAIALTMAFTPFIGQAAKHYSLKLCNPLCDQMTDSEIKDFSETQTGKERALFIVGMNEVGCTIARAMEHAKIPYIGIDYERERFLNATSAGYIVAFGQSSNLQFWNTIGIRNARAMMIATPRYEVAKSLSPIVKRLYPSLRRYVAVDDSSDSNRYAALGMMPYHHHGAPPGIELACFLLQEFSVPDKIIDEWREQEQASYKETNTIIKEPEKNAELKDVA